MRRLRIERDRLLPTFDHLYIYIYKYILCVYKYLPLALALALAAGTGTGPVLQHRMRTAAILFHKGEYYDTITITGASFSFLSFEVGTYLTNTMSKLTRHLMSITKSNAIFPAN